MTLTKKYRLWWDAEKIIQNNYEMDYEHSITYCGNAAYIYFETNTMQEIEQKIQSENLIIQAEQ